MPNRMTVLSKLLDRVSKRFVAVCLLVVFGVTLINFPNPITHECTANIRTLMGISSEGYPAKSHFCDTGYYPVLRFSQENVIANRIIELSFVLLPLLLILPILIIILNKQDSRHKKNK